ncbi:uncharacterized protein Z520_11743 [Fonsecaea multimorphosa CBS 102226]|uniref:Uncharacterized protein n=1 Tax=Fonsecaea multimorphosa CBS 102226 TaxID=1442371 RepID=A0A0D2JHB4_9EURO|nr:uncharacterized protein Z520_11743 [Fonsecaea multimorphosa CBS 102226]KIX92567.1 hypothetical protein Z520_11743 [Fonsecaea multimorphosa CBS 102226]
MSWQRENGLQIQQSVHDSMAPGSVPKKALSRELYTLKFCIANVRKCIKNELKNVLDDRKL